VHVPKLLRNSAVELCERRIVSRLGDALVVVDVLFEALQRVRVHRASNKSSAGRALREEMMLHKLAEPLAR
jgi:hypothetical protein